jgi:hypothetical protein
MNQNFSWKSIFFLQNLCNIFAFKSHIWFQSLYFIIIIIIIIFKKFIKCDGKLLTTNMSVQNSATTFIMYCQKKAPQGTIPSSVSHLYCTI